MTINRTPIVEQVSQYLRSNIESGKWLVGEKIPSETQLTQQLKVSRHSLRMAIQGLASQGVLESFHGKGTYVLTNQLSLIDTQKNAITAEDYLDVRKVLEFRRAIEPETCFLAAQRISDETLHMLEENYREMQVNIGNSEKFVKHDLLFHLEIAKASENHLLYGALREVFDNTLRNLELLNVLYGYSDGLFYHKKILKALRAKDSVLARTVMSEHIQKAIDSLDT
jgi:GntR family transcriptional repressor for pyruvate dehydrogenase complex